MHAPMIFDRVKPDEGKFNCWRFTGDKRSLREPMKARLGVNGYHSPAGGRGIALDSWPFESVTILTTRAC